MWDLGAKCWASEPIADHDDRFVDEAANAPVGRNEKTVPIENTLSQSDDNSDFDGSVQDGVREVEAVTSAWDSKSLILVFFLYVLICFKVHETKLTPSKHLRDLHGGLDALHNVYRVLGLCH